MDTFDVNLLWHNINIIKKNTTHLIDTRKEVGLEINAEKTKYTLTSHHQNAGQNHDIMRANRAFEKKNDKVQIFMNEKNKSKFNS
jgi:hypothetical protein